MSVCLSLCHVFKVYKNRWTDQHVDWTVRVDPGGPKEPCIRWAEVKRQFWGLFGPLKSTVSHCSGVCSKKINNSMSLTAAADSPVSHLRFPPWRIPPHHEVASCRNSYARDEQGDNPRIGKTGFDCVLYNIHPVRYCYHDILRMAWATLISWQGIFASPYWWSHCIMKVKSQSHDRQSMWRHPRQKAGASKSG